MEQFIVPLAKTKCAYMFVRHIWYVRLMICKYMQFSAVADIYMAKK